MSLETSNLIQSSKALHVTVFFAKSHLKYVRMLVCTFMEGKNRCHYVKLHNLSDVKPRTRKIYLIFLSLQFLICKTGIIILVSQIVVIRINMVIHVKNQVSKSNDSLLVITLIVSSLLLII